LRNNSFLYKVDSAYTHEFINELTAALNFLLSVYSSLGTASYPIDSSLYINNRSWLKNNVQKIGTLHSRIHMYLQIYVGQDLSGDTFEISNVSADVDLHLNLFQIDFIFYKVIWYHMHNTGASSSKFTETYYILIKVFPCVKASLNRK